MARTPTVTRDQVPEQLRSTFDAETANSGGVVAAGPGSVMINSPEMRRRANSLVNYLRDESSLPKKIQELAMILTARSRDLISCNSRGLDVASSYCVYVGMRS